jgi:PcRGLX-like N-terminal RIFT barrel domain
MSEFRVPILIDERAGIDRSLAWVRFGIPMPKGVLREAAAAILLDEEGQPLPVQTRALAFWPERSVKWLLVDTLATVRANERLRVFLCDSGSEARPGCTEPQGIRTVEHGATWTIDTGAAVFKVGGDPAAILDAVRVGGVDLVDASGVTLRLTGCTGRTYQAIATRRWIEEQGPLGVALASAGRLQAVDGRETHATMPALAFRSRVLFNRGSGIARLEVILHNPRPARHPGGLWDLNDQGTVLFEDLSVSFRPARAASRLCWYAERAQEARAEEMRDWCLYQDSSGGENWSSDNHVDGEGAQTVTFRGYRVERRCATGAVVIAEGDRATPWVSVDSEHGTLAATALEFWQNFPKALRCRNGALEVGLFPGECPAQFALQGGEQKRHAVLLEFLPPQSRSGIASLQQSLEAAVDPAWIECSGAIECFVAARRDCNDRYLNYIQSIIEGPESFEAKRERIDEYGWRHFGDLHADHESVGTGPPRQLPSHYNNQYDFVHGALVHFLRTGDRRWWRLADAGVRHMIDIDIYHTDGDRPEFNHGLFWHTDHYLPAATCTHRTYSRHNSRGTDYGGGPGNEHNYTSGATLYFYLTGDPEAELAVRELAGWVIAMDEAPRGLLAIAGDWSTGLASRTLEPSYHKAGRGAGNSINALLDAWQLTTEARYLRKAEVLVRRCIHPEDDIEELHLDKPEDRWSYLVFLQVLGRYLHLKLDADQVDYMFHYARASLLHYARWMVTHEVPYKEVMHKVDIPTETWPAHDMRKCHILHVAAEFAPPEEAASLHERAALFFERSIADVLSFETAYLTRPLVILAVCGYVHAYYQHRAVSGVDVAAAAPSSFGEPERFVPLPKRSLAALAARTAELLTRVFRAAGERLDLFGRYSTPERL